MLLTMAPSVLANYQFALLVIVGGVAELHLQQIV